MASRYRSRRRAGRVDAGAAWISYSDMMAALLLVFVLVLCYSMYQYFSMLETKSAELDQQSALLASQSAQLEDQQASLADKENALLTKQNELDSALTALETQKGLLDSQSQTLADQQETIAASQSALQDKEDALTALQAQLTDQQSQLSAATSLLQSQQAAMDAQQVKLDNLVGVRTKIIEDLSAALAQAQLKASVDQNTGDIMLESAVFFDVGKNTIKASGQTLLNSFVPVYLSVLLRDEYVDYLGEIIIEGHTDTKGTYLLNLALSQERALSVATYCLEMNGLTSAQQEKLRQILTAKGRSYSSPIYNADGTVNMDASRRVEFKFRLKDSEMIDEIRGILSN
ncbi:MAG: OmpA family protein [Eubacteriales bacterium]|nr:OmpA family protein [Eubacteriales bacterium]